MKDEQLRQYAIYYLLNSGFVENYTKKLIIPADIDNLYEDYVQEVWLSILEIKDEKWRAIYNSSVNRGKGFEYEIRNYISVVIRNTVRSTSSNAFKKLKSYKIKEQTKTTTDWKIMSETIADD